VTCTAAGGERIAFSVDLRNGVPVVSPNGPAGLSRASDIAARAAAAGVGAVVVLDLARVGTGAGIDVQLMEDVRKAAPRVVLLAGGGVRDSADLDALAAAGCDGALVATALLSGAIDASGRDKALSRDDRDSSRPLRGHPRSE
jgi:phosphoribosylformimino-5-aminoimidazole carboxamide ribotide isomerase